MAFQGQIYLLSECSPLLTRNALCGLIHNLIAYSPEISQPLASVA
jgi:hypothetical protein